MNISKKLKLILLIPVMATLFFAKPSFAGVSNSIGTGSSSGGGGSVGQSWGIGYSRSPNGLAWVGFKGSKELICEIPFFNRTHQVKNASKGYYLTLDSKKENKTTWLNWAYWDSCLKAPSNYDYMYKSRGLLGVYTKTGHGMLPDPEVVAEANKNGFKYNSTGKYYTNGKQKLDAVWVEGYQESATDTITTIVYAEAGGSALMKDRSNESASSLYNNPTKSLTYTGKSGPTEMSHSKTIEATFMKITKTETYMTNGSKKWNVKTTYSKGGKTYSSKTIKYNVKQASISEKYYKPYDLNRNGLALDSDVKSSYPSYSASSPLLMSVNNRQNITDGSALKTLDTNTKLSFNVKFNNDQFGLPTAAQGGFDLLLNAPGSSYKNSNGTYSASVLDEVGLQGNAATGQLSADGMSAVNVNGKISKDAYWGGSLKADLSANSASLTYSGAEKIGGNSFSFGKGWTGGDFVFKTTKMGIYNLSSNGRNWWEAQYEQGKFYCYGVEYKGTITVGNISNPSIVNSNLYARLASKTVTQPVLKGKFEAKTVAGNLG